MSPFHTDIVELSSTESNLREQLRRLNEQYNALKDVKERVAERYKVDFKKLRAFKDWLFAEDTKHHGYRNKSGITLEEKRERDVTSIMCKKRKMIEIGPDLAQFEGEPEDGDVGILFLLSFHNDTHNCLSQLQQIGYGPHHWDVPSRHCLLKPITDMAVVSSSPTMFLSSSNPVKAKGIKCPTSIFCPRKNNHRYLTLLIQRMTLKVTVRYHPIQYLSAHSILFSRRIRSPDQCYSWRR